MLELHGICTVLFSVIALQDLQSEESCHIDGVLGNLVRELGMSPLLSFSHVQILFRKLYYTCLALYFAQSKVGIIKV